MNKSYKPIRDKYSKRDKMGKKSKRQFTKEILSPINMLKVHNLDSCFFFFSTKFLNDRFESKVVMCVLKMNKFFDSAVPLIPKK